MKNAEKKVMVWPEKPAKARILFKRSFHEAKDLGISKGFFRKIVDFFSGEKDIYLVKPMDVVALDNGIVFVADPGAGGIHRFNPEDNEHHLLKLEDDVPLVTPVGMTIGPNNVVYISDSTLGVFKIEKGADVIKPVKLELDPRQGTGISYDKKNHLLYIVDTLEHEIKIYNDSFELVGGIGKRGLGDGEFNYPTMVWTDARSNIYVADSLNFRVQIFSSDGEHIGQFGKAGMSTGSQSRPKGIATDSFGHIYVVDSLFHAVQVFDQQGRYLLTFGEQGSEDGQFWLPTGIFIGGKRGTTIYVSDSFNKRVQVFDYIGGAS
ncbi:MAG: 6-bladed beta-propeller [Gammaproteobacteria bacterium]|nr:6-bladed beta-propeller [Gammaproteobacteria bacterium]